MVFCCFCTTPAKPGADFEPFCVEIGLTKKYCASFVTFGLACDPSKCAGLLHLPFYKWNDADKETQIQHVDSNKDKMCIAKKNGRNIPPQKGYIWGDENGPASKKNYFYLALLISLITSTFC